LSSACLKLFSGGLVLILIFPYVSNINRAAACIRKPVVGFVTASFEGGRKCGKERRRLLEFQVGRVRRGPATIACHEIQLESDREWFIGFGAICKPLLHVTKKGNPHVFNQRQD